MRIKVKRKIPRQLKVKKRKDNSYIKGRKYNDYKQYLSENCSVSIVEMDTVYNDSNGPYIQMFMLVKYALMIAVYHENKMSQSMVNGLNYIHNAIKDEMFKKHFQVIITDRGLEFSKASAFEYDSNGKQTTRIFYCDPMASSQKPHVENNHRILRYICPKSCNLHDLGLTSQDKLDLVFSHINSLPRQEYNNKTPIEIFNFYNGDDLSFIEKVHIKKIDKDQVTLKPYLLK